MGALDGWPLSCPWLAPGLALASPWPGPGWPLAWQFIRGQTRPEARLLDQEENLPLGREEDVLLGREVDLLLRQEEDLLICQGEDLLRGHPFLFSFRAQAILLKSNHDQTLSVAKCGLKKPS